LAKYAERTGIPASKLTNPKFLVRHALLEKTSWSARSLDAIRDDAPVELRESENRYRGALREMLLRLAAVRAVPEAAVLEELDQRAEMVTRSQRQSADNMERHQRRLDEYRGQGEVTKALRRIEVERKESPTSR
jgi:hypothetical protein